MTRNQKRASFRKLARTGQVSESRIGQVLRVAEADSKKIYRSDIPALMAAPALNKRRKPHQAWNQDRTSPYYWNYTTIDKRWDK